MADNNSFSISRKGYTCSEVDEFISYARQSEAQLRDSYASLQEKYDALFEENSKLRKDCTALAVALQKLHETVSAEASNDNENLLKAENAELKAENVKLKTENETLKAEIDIARKKDDEAGNFYGNTASKMIEEVAQVVQKFEKDAQRKAEAITAAARLEQEKVKLIREQVNHEVRSLLSMLDSFVKDTEEVTVEIIDEEE